MKQQFVKPVKRVWGDMNVPGDKSISHRSVIFGALAQGRSVIKGFLKSEDCLHTLDCFKEMGIDFLWQGEHHLEIEGKGLHGLQKPARTLYVGNSGTSIRLLSGLLSGQAFSSKIEGDQSIAQRPMRRVIEPLRLMGADISGPNDRAPLNISPAKLKGLSYFSPVASAQVKSCLLLAGLYADSPVDLGEPHLSRNHSELMFKRFGNPLVKSKEFAIGVRLEERKELQGQNLTVPGDVSSAAFFLVLASIVPGARLLIRNVGLNATRAGIISVLQRMGASIEVANEDVSYEPVGDISVHFSKLKGTVMEGEEIANIIDEIPVLAIAAAFAEGQTIIREAKELRVKESDRIATMVKALKAIGVSVQELEDGMVIEGSGGNLLEGGSIETCGDHRVAMSLAVAAAMTQKGVIIDDVQCIQTSFPGFFTLLESVVS